MPTTVQAEPSKRHYRTPSRLARHVAPRLGLQPASVEQLIHGHDSLPDRFGALVEAAVELGDLTILARLLSRTDAALAKLPATDCRADLELAEEIADGGEDVSRAEYQKSATRDTARARLLAIRAHRFRLLVLERALCNQWDLR